MSLLFFSSALVILYIYLGYPLAVLMASRARPKIVRAAPIEPNVTILIAAFNEEKHIGATIENKLMLEYPQDKIEIIVISDGSDDDTDKIVATFADRGVRLIRQEPRQGKTAAINLAVPQARGEIIIFSDANSIYDPKALACLLRNFADPEVGYVTGKMIYVNPDGTTVGDGCSMYMKYENLLRDLETRLGSVVGVDGGIDAVRKSLYKPMRADQLPDFVLPLKVVEQGFRVVYEPEAHLREEALKQAEDEYRMRVRVSLRALWALWDMRALFDFTRFGTFAWQLFSHKLLRYLGIVFMIMAYAGNMLIAGKSRVYRIFLLIQTIFYAAAWYAQQLEREGRPLRWLSIPYYFTLINVAAGHALLRFLRGEKQVLWTPRKG